MKKKIENELPTSVIKGSGFINFDISYDNRKVLFLDTKCVVIGIESTPFMIFLTPEFLMENLPFKIKQEINKVTEVCLKPTFLEEPPKYLLKNIPFWLLELKNLSVLGLEDIDICNLEEFADLPIVKFIFRNVKFDAINMVITSIQKFKFLKEIFCDQVFFNEIGSDLKGISVKILDQSNAIM